MHVLFFLALSRTYTPQADKAVSGTAVTFLTPVTAQKESLPPKNEHRKEERQEAELQKADDQKLSPAIKKESVQAPRAATSDAPTEKLPTPTPTAKSFADITAGTEAEVPAKAAVSLAQLRSQATSIARESAQAEGSESGYTGILGDYYGSYNGADAGTFYIHVDHTGNIFGSADSGTAHSSFTITGKVSTNGVVQMTGKGLAGSASFDGKINLKTGGVSGHWNLTGFGRGQFDGQRAKGREY
ncbi:hypothetical protein [Undibacterium sp. YM2]|uniref:hypothetical protein n=1 Tax=Undibacterium sp. YM2 TaxID=2058625 RepID=UPI00138A0C80|nr:hypothetical protein [Undibacterium sp. YM2]